MSLKGGDNWTFGCVELGMRAGRAAANSYNLVSAPGWLEVVFTGMKSWEKAAVGHRGGEGLLVLSLFCCLSYLLDIRDWILSLEKVHWVFVLF